MGRRLGWSKYVESDVINFFVKGEKYYMCRLYHDSPNNNNTILFTFDSYGPNDELDTFEDGRGVLHFFGANFTPLYIETQLENKGLSLYDLVSDNIIKEYEEIDPSHIERLRSLVEVEVVVSSKAIVPRAVIQYINNINNPDVTILDFGSGKESKHTYDLRHSDLNVHLL